MWKIIMRLSLICSGLLSTVLFITSQGVAQSSDTKTTPSPTVATVGNRPITLNEFKVKYAEAQQQAVNTPPPEVFLEDLVRFEVGVQEAEKRNLRNDPIVQERIRQELYKALLERAIGERVNNITVNEQEMRAYYSRNPEIRTSHILFEIKPTATPEQKAEVRRRAQQIYQEVRNSKRPFEELVKLYSDDPISKNSGGDIGYQSRITLVAPYYEAALKMKVGDIHGLVETPFGFHIQIGRAHV